MGFVLIVGFILLLGVMAKRPSAHTYGAVALVSVVAAYLIYFR